MSLLAEEIVEEWLNRQGYFTIRGIKIGVDEIDLLAIRVNGEGVLERRHFEVQVSIRPVSYICRVPKEVQRMTGRAPNSAKRSHDELIVGVGEYIDRKYKKSSKTALMQCLAPGPWTSELVLHNVKSQKEVELFLEKGIRIHRLVEIVRELHTGRALVQSASGGDLLELVHLSAAVRTGAGDVHASAAGIVAATSEKEKRAL